MLMRDRGSAQSACVLSRALVSSPSNEGAGTGAGRARTVSSNWSFSAGSTITEGGMETVEADAERDVDLRGRSSKLSLHTLGKFGSCSYVVA